MTLHPFDSALPAGEEYVTVNTSGRCDVSSAGISCPTSLASAVLTLTTMLPDKTKTLTESLVQSYEAEHPMAWDFRAARNKVIWANRAAKGAGGWSSGQVVEISEAYVELVRTKARAVWDGMKEIVTVTVHTPYAQLATDLKALHQASVANIYRFAESEMRQLLIDAHCPKGYTMQAEMKLKSITTPIHHDIDLFCERHYMKPEKPALPPIAITAGQGSNIAIGNSAPVTQGTQISVQTFNDLRKAIESNVKDEGRRRELLLNVDELERQKGTSAFKGMLDAFLLKAKTWAPVVSIGKALWDVYKKTH